MAVDIRAAAAEFLALLIFVFFTTGCAATGAGAGNGNLAICFQFGLLIMVLAYAIGQYSGGQINCAVTFGLVLAGKLDPVQAGVNFVAQLAGGICASILVCIIVDKETNMTIGTNHVSDGYSAGQAFLAEILGTFLLMYTVLETAVNDKNNSNAGITAPIAIGMAVFLAHVFMIPIDGCSINPTRTFGPILVASVGERYGANMESSDMWEDHWVYWAGPLVGAAVAVGVYKLMTEVLAPKEAAPAEDAA